MEDVYAQKPWLKSYDKEVSPSLTYPSTSYGKFIRRAFEAVPDRAALIYMGRIISFRELDLLSNQLAWYLRKQGLAEGDVVGVHTLSNPAGCIAMVGIQKAGCVYTGVSVLLRPEELEHQLNDSGAKVLITMDIFYGSVSRIIDRTQVHTVLVTSSMDYLPGNISAPLNHGSIPGIEIKPFIGAIDGMPDRLMTDASDPGAPCLMMYTGGTTGPPKGAVLTHQNIVHHIIQIAHWFNIGMADFVFLSAFPIFHQAGNIMVMISYAFGATSILVPNPRDHQFIVSAIKNYQPNAIINVPTIYLELMKLPEFRALDFSGVRWFMSGASPFPTENIREFESLVGPGKLAEVYGMTETSPVITAPPHQGVKKVGSVGIPLSDTEVRLVDPSDEVVSLGEAGELVAKGPQVFTKGYHNKPEETAHALREGWMHTGDVCVMDEDGYFYVVDRLKDMVSVSGYKVFTRQVDDILIEHPDIESAATVGIPDPSRPGSEIVASAIVLKPGREKDEDMQEKITLYMKEKVAPYKVPKVIQFMDQLPMSSIGKILKRELRNMISAPK